MFKDVEKIPNKYLAAGTVVAVLITVLIGVDMYQKNKLSEGVSPENLLKVPKEKIINYRIAQPEKSGDVAKSQPIVVYHYVSDQEVPPATMDGLQEDMAQRTPNAQIFLKSIMPISDKLQKEEYVAKFYTAPTFQKDGDKWYQIETTTTTPVAFTKQTKLTLLDKAKELLGQKVLADTFYSGAGDGYIQKKSTDSWAVTHNSLTGSSAYPIALSSSVRSQSNGASPDYEIGRSFLPFNTSSIPSDALIISATLNVYILTLGDGDNDGQDYINIVQSTQADSSTLVTADYSKDGAISNPTQGALAIDLTSGFTTSAYNTFTLNSTGLGWVTKSGVTSSCGVTAGVTCLGLREGHDIENAAIADLTTNSIYISTSEETGTSQDPYLTVTYTTVAPSTLKINGGTLKINGGTLKIN